VPVVHAFSQSAAVAGLPPLEVPAPALPPLELPPLELPPLELPPLELPALALAPLALAPEAVPALASPPPADSPPPVATLPAPPDLPLGPSNKLVVAGLPQAATHINAKTAPQKRPPPISPSRIGAESISKRRYAVDGCASTSSTGWLVPLTTMPASALAIWRARLTPAK
jgi:hypothetical protein